MSQQQRQQPYPNYIRYFCKQQGYTLQALAEKLGIPRRTLSDYAAGTRPIPRARLVKIARALGCSVKELIPPSALAEYSESEEITELETASDRLSRGRKTPRKAYTSQKYVTASNSSLPIIPSPPATYTILVLPSSSINHSPVEASELTPDHAGSWLAKEICQFGQLFTAGWSNEDVLSALKILLPTVRAIQAISNRQPKSINQSVGSGAFPPFDIHSLSEMEKGHMTWTVGSCIAGAWKCFHTSGPYQSLTIAQALLSILQQYHAIVIPSFRPLFYAGTYRLIGAALFFLERYQEAQHAQNSAYIAALECADLWNIAQSNIWQVYGYQAQKNYSEAMQLIINTLRMTEGQHDEAYQRIRGHLFALWGENATFQQQHDIANEKIQYASYIARDLGWNEEFDQRLWLHIAGRCALFAQDYHTAIHHFENALEQLTSDNTMLQTTIFTSLATAYARSGRQEASIAVIKKSLASLYTFNAPIIQRQLYECIQNDLQSFFPNDRHIQSLAMEIQYLASQSMIYRTTQ